MTANQCVQDILKPFQGVLNALAVRHAQRSENTIRGRESSQPEQSLRKRASREFHIWDRVKESLQSPDTMRTEVNNLAASLVPPTKIEVPETLPTPTQLVKNKTSLERAKTTSSRLKSLEDHLNLGEKLK